MTALAYKVWQVDCDCGSVITYDADTHPSECEDCGSPVEDVEN